MVQGNPSFAQSRLARELRGKSLKRGLPLPTNLCFAMTDVANNDDLGASIGLENDDDLFLWNVTFEGPENSLYEVSLQAWSPSPRVG